jgi:ATP-dependent Lon protease
MTGEATLRGAVLPVGGIKEKVLAAHRAGITTILLPERCKKDLVEVPQEIRDVMTFHFCSRMEATSGPSVMLSFEHAVAVLSHVPWAAINDPVQWLEVALAALPLRPQRRYK